MAVWPLRGYVLLARVPRKGCVPLFMLVWDLRCLLPALTRLLLAFAAWDMHARVCKSVVETSAFSEMLLTSPDFANNTAVFARPACEASGGPYPTIKRLFMPDLVRVPLDLPH